MRYAVPAQLGKARPTLTWQPTIEQGADGLDHWKFLGAYTDPNVDWEYLQTGRDEKVGPFVTFNAEYLGDPIPVQLYTHILCDPQFQGRPGQALSFQVRGDFTDDGLTLTVIEQDRSLQAHSYSATVPAKDLAPGWREVVLPLSRFTGKDGRPPARWQDLDKLEIRGKAAQKGSAAVRPACAGWTPPDHIIPYRRLYVNYSTRRTGRWASFLVLGALTLAHASATGRAIRPDSL